MHPNHVRASNFSSQKKTPWNRLLLWIVCFVYVYFCVQKCPLFHRYEKLHSLCISFCSLSLSLLLSLSTVYAKWSKTALSLYNLPQQVSIHSHGTIKFQWMTLHKLKRVWFCVWMGGGMGADLGEVMADTQAAMQWAVTKAYAVTWSMKLTQAKGTVFSKEV